MTKRIALVSRKPLTVIGQWTLAEDSTEIATRIELPGGGQLSPVQLGWENDEFAVLEIEPFVVPDDRQVVGEPRYDSISTGRLVETFDVVKIPAPKASDYRLARWQFEAMVDLLGIGPAIEAAIESMPVGVQKSIARSLYRSSDYYERDAPVLKQIAAAMGLTDQQIDEAWLAIAVAEPV